MHPSSFSFGGRPLLDMLCSFRRHAAVPVFVHVDHAAVEDESDVIAALG
jgi:fructose/tagatose bisphosphate aldolase